MQGKGILGNGNGSHEDPELYGEVKGQEDFGAFRAQPLSAAGDGET